MESKSQRRCSSSSVPDPSCCVWVATLSLWVETKLALESCGLFLSLETESDRTYPNIVQLATGPSSFSALFVTPVKNDHMKSALISKSICNSSFPWLLSASSMSCKCANWLLPVFISWLPMGEQIVDTTLQSLLMTACLCFPRLLSLVHTLLVGWWHHFRRFLYTKSHSVPVDGKINRYLACCVM